jgi:PAS domain S-box-containing protein
MNANDMTNETVTEASQQLLRTLIDNLPDYIYVKDRLGRFLMDNVAHARMLGAAAPREVIGKTEFDWRPREVAEQSAAEAQALMQSGETVHREESIVDKSTGETHWLHTTELPLRDSAGLVVGLIGISRDITEQKQAQAELRLAHDDLEKRVADRTNSLSEKNAALEHQIAERERVEENLARERLLLRTLIDNLPDCIYAKDMEGRKVMANMADLDNMRVKTEAEAIGRTDFDMFPAEIAAKFWEDDKAVLRGTPVLNREEWFFDSQGQKRWLLTSKLPRRDQNGTIIGLIGIGRNITRQKEAEDKLEAVHKELMVASRYAGMAEVATGVLHNVGNVLNSVNVSAELMDDRLRNSRSAGVAKLAKLLRDREADLVRFLSEDERGRRIPAYLEELAGHLEKERGEMRAELERLHLNIGHIKEIVTAQQNYARLAGVTETVSLPELVEDALKIHSGAFARHGVKVIREFEPLPQVVIDKHKVLQIVVNLLHNAKYACEDGNTPDKHVIVRLQPAGADRIKIQVADSGVGIAPENLTKIFSHGFTTRKNGHGFGLHSGALSAKEMGGLLTVSSEGVGKGATFTLELPLQPITAQAEPDNRNKPVSVGEPAAS